MDNAAVTSKSQASSVLAPLAQQNAQKVQADGGQAFSSFLVFSGRKLDSALPMPTTRVLHEQPTEKVSKPRAEEKQNERGNDFAPVRDREDAPRADDASDKRETAKSDDAPERDTQSNRDKGDDSNREARNDNRNDSRDEAKNASQESNRDSSNDGKKADNASNDQANGADNAGAAKTEVKGGDDLADQAAANTFAQSAAAAAQVATDPALMNAAKAQVEGPKGPVVADAVKDALAGTNPQGTQKELFSSNWNTDPASANAKAQAAQNNQGPAQNFDQAAADAALRGQNVSQAAQQAAHLSKVVDNKPMTIGVQVTDQSATMMSQPTHTLAQNVDVAVTSNQQTGQNQQQQQNSQGQQNGANAQQGQNATLNLGAQQSQQAANQQNQAQNFQNALNDAKAAAATATQKAAGPQMTQAQTGDSVMANASVTNSQNSTQTQQAAEAKQMPQQRPHVHTSARLDQINVEITKAAQAGADKVSIQLRPAELGRIEVQLEMAGHGKVHATVIVDRPETLEMLKNDARNLGKALADAGLDAGNMNFNLRDQQNDGQGGRANKNGAQFANNSQGDDSLFTDTGSIFNSETAISQRARARAAAGGVDIQA